MVREQQAWISAVSFPVCGVHERDETLPLRYKSFPPFRASL